MSSLLLDHIEPALLKAVKERAQRQGQTPPEYVRAVLQREVRASRSLDEILQPVRDDLRARGITEAALDAIIERARNGRRKRTPPRR